MESKGKLTKELVAQEARFVLDHLLNASRYGGDTPVDELQRLCEHSVSLRLADYLSFLERFGYLAHDRASDRVSISSDGERVVAGEKVAELMVDVVHHFRPILTRSRPREQPARASRTRESTRSRERLDDRYEKLRTLGSGGIGTVYVARQVMLDREVALKELRELFSFFTEPQRQEIARRFDEEVRAAARLSHPNIAAIVDGNTGRDYPYVVSELISGGSLRRVLRYAEEFPPDVAVKIFLQILHGLRHAHEQGAIHRGLKPENVLFDAAGNVRLTDFGMARVVERDRAVIKHVYVGMGSVAYLAPELFSDPQAAGVQSDLYAAGIVLYEMLAGRLPGRRSPMPTKLHPELPKIVDDIFDKLTQDEQDERYASADAVLEDFYGAEAAKPFLEPSGAVMFRDNPLRDIKIEEPEEERAAEPEWDGVAERDESDGLGPAGTPPAEDDGGALDDSTPSATPPAGAPADTSFGRPAETDSMPVTGETPLAPSDLSGEAPIQQVPSDGQGRRRRARAHRPYSFQQRIKERENK